MSNLQRRVQKLERTEMFKRHLPPLERFQRALNEAALRLAGKDISLVQIDEPAMVLVMDEVRDTFLGKLNAADLDNLRAELETIAFGDDTAARDAAWQKVIRVADEEFGAMTT
jgi:hypothetical protein